MVFIKISVSTYVNINVKRKPGKVKMIKKYVNKKEIERHLPGYFP